MFLSDPHTTTQLPAETKPKTAPLNVLGSGGGGKGRGSNGGSRKKPHPPYQPVEQVTRAFANRPRNGGGDSAVRVDGVDTDDTDDMDDVDDGSDVDDGEEVVDVDEARNMDVGGLRVPPFGTPTDGAGVDSSTPPFTTTTSTTTTTMASTVPPSTCSACRERTRRTYVAVCLCAM